MTALLDASMQCTCDFAAKNISHKVKCQWPDDCDCADVASSGILCIFSRPCCACSCPTHVRTFLRKCTNSRGCRMCQRRPMCCVVVRERRAFMRKSCSRGAPTIPAFFRLLTSVVCLTVCVCWRCARNILCSQQNSSETHKMCCANKQNPWFLHHTSSCPHHPHVLFAFEPRDDMSACSWMLGECFCGKRDAQLRSKK